jgi:hypothetical protein
MRRWWISDGVVTVEVGPGPLRNPAPPDLGTRIGVHSDQLDHWVRYLETDRRHHDRLASEQRRAKRAKRR